ncbi:sensor histidine kinase [Sphingobium aquiterrae]|uniref:sensor histidine kinase n=1 Tax=Sphingobium aquiterrae TaxID=2038656 RepID=UPI00301866B9
MVKLLGDIADRFGRSPMAILGIARLVVGFLIISYLGIAVMHVPELGRAARYGRWLVVAWIILFPATKLLSARMEMGLRPLLLLVDFQLLMIVVALLRQLELPALCCALVLLWAIHERLGRTITGLAAIGIILTLLVRHNYGPWDAVLAGTMDLSLIDSGTVVIGCLGSVAAIGVGLRRSNLKLWADRLQAVGGNVSELPTGLLLGELAAICNARHCGILWRNLVTDEIVCLRWEDGTVERLNPMPALATALLHPRIPDTPFLFGRGSDEVLLRNTIGSLRLRAAPELMDAIMQTYGLGQGAGFPVVAGDIAGMGFVALRHGWAAGALDQLMRIQESVEIFFERYYFLVAWRERSFAEARQAMSRDLHDSVLQTLAALRIRLATLRGRIGAPADAMLAQDVEGLQQLIIAEQQNLRKLLQQSARDADLEEDMSACLKRCASLAAAQWNVECLPILERDGIMVSRAVAIQVEFLVREMVANAVQHAHARKITVAVSVQDDQLVLAFRDDSGWNGTKTNSEEGEKEIIVQSRSLKQRLSAIGGRAYFDRLDKSSIISVQIPIRMGAPK